MARSLCGFLLPSPQSCITNLPIIGRRATYSLSTELGKLLFTLSSTSNIDISQCRNKQGIHMNHLPYHVRVMENASPNFGSDSCQSNL